MSKWQLNLRAILEFLVVGICTFAFSVLLVGVGAALFGPNAAGSRDYIEYWAAGQQIVHHQDPYDEDAILQLERSARYPADLTVQVMGNPPSALPLLLPLGLVGPRTGLLLWELLLVTVVITSVYLIREMYGSPKNLLHLLGFSFAPTLSCLLAGQVGILILLGLVLFLRWHLSRPFLAGASLWLCLLKPHLFLPFGVVLLVWIALTRSYRILAGTAAAMGISCSVATMMNPAIWTQYQSMMKTERIDRLPLPCLSPMLRVYVYPHTMWLQCLPAFLGCVWALAYFLKRRHKWNWVEDGSILMLVSVFVAPYSWFFDQVILIPAVLHGIYSTRSRTYVAIFALMSAVIEIGALRGVKLDSKFYLWTAPAWLVWYVLATRTSQTIDARNLASQISEAV
jgi:hypothetical protein